MDASEVEKLSNVLAKVHLLPSFLEEKLPPITLMKDFVHQGKDRIDSKPSGSRFRTTKCKACR